MDFKILAPFSGISLGCRLDFERNVLKFSSLEMLHVVRLLGEGRITGSHFNGRWGWAKGKFLGLVFELRARGVPALHTSENHVSEALGTKFSSQKQSFSKYLHNSLTHSCRDYSFGTSLPIHEQASALKRLNTFFIHVSGWRHLWSRALLNKQCQRIH